jgi:quercetin 2,3-dioxygenase
MSLRPVKSVTQSQPVKEGAGVHLHRAFGFGKTKDFDPFLLFDDFRNDDPDQYRAGFPWHPHRGIETITYVLAGTVEHADSIGNHGEIGPGDLQWMTAGRGIVHHEMPKGDAQGAMHGFQLWANLPAAQKMTAPRYQEVKSPDIPEVTDDDGTKVRIIAGEFWGQRGPIDGIAANPTYVDIWIPPNQQKVLPLAASDQSFAYVFAGDGRFANASGPLPVQMESGEMSDVRNRSLVLFDRADRVVVKAGERGLRFLFVSGKPLQEPVAWYGPIVMNTNAEIRQAIADLESGQFLS